MNGPRKVTLTAGQAARVRDARADLDATRDAAIPAIDYPIFTGRLRARLSDLLALIAELTGGAA